jgi:hypothetical protein
LDIVADCTTQRSGGVETVAYLGHISDATFTFDATNPSKITTIAIAVGAKLVKLKGVKRSLNSGHELSAEANRAVRYPHSFDFEAYEIDTPSREQLDAMDDGIFVVYERRDVPATLSGDGQFIAKGVALGLRKTADTLSENESQGARAITLATHEEDLGERYSAYTVLSTDAAGTRAMLEALTVTQE